MGDRPYRIMWAVIAFIAIVWLAALRHFHLDDGAIYARVIQQWVDTHVATFNTRDPAFPVTSQLWFMVNALVVKALSIDDIYGYLRGASAAFYFAGWAVFYLAARRYIRSPYVLVGTTLLLVTDEISIEYATTGMDTSLALFMASLNLYLFGSRYEGLAGGLAVVTRPENVFLVAVRALDRALSRRFRDLLQYLVLAAAAAVPVILFVGSVSPAAPNTISVKSTHFEIFTMLVPNLKRVVLIMGALCTGPLLALLLTARGRLIDATRDATREEVVRTSILFPAAVLGSMIALLNRDVLMARYLAIFIPFLYLSFGIVADRAVAVPGSSGSRWIYACAVNVALILTMGLANTREAYTAYHQTRLKEVELLKRHAKPGDTYIAFGIGVVGYETRIDLVDLVGLATPGAVPPNSDEECKALLELYQPDYFGLVQPRTTPPLTKGEWPDCRIDFPVEVADSVDIEVFEGKYTWWGAPTPLRLTLYRIKGWEPKMTATPGS